MGPGGITGVLTPIRQVFKWHGRQSLLRKMDSLAGGGNQFIEVFSVKSNPRDVSFLSYVAEFMVDRTGTFKNNV